MDDSKFDGRTTTAIIVHRILSRMAFHRYRERSRERCRESGLESDVESGLESDVESGLESDVESGLEIDTESGLAAISTSKCDLVTAFITSPEHFTH